MNRTKPVAQLLADGGARLLVVEDERNIRLLLASVLKAKGYSVVGAADSAEALHHLRHDPNIALIITKYRILDIDGGQLIEAVRQEFLKMPIVVISAAEHETEALAEGANAFLAKPFTSSQLLSTIRNLL
jgi:CheY-like chemotaxis protein